MKENMHQSSIENAVLNLELLDPFVGSLTLNKIHTGSLQSFIDARKRQGCKNKTINIALGVVRRILNLASMEWIDENGLTWLANAPRIKLLSTKDSRQPYPISWDEQDRLFNELPEHLKQMCLYKVNTGCREQEVCQLRWEWETPIPELETSVFIIPAWIVRNGRMQSMVKNGEDRLVVLNDVAKNVIEQRRGIDSTHVFTYKGHPICRINNTAWRKAKERANLLQFRVHDLKHTFGRRLRSVGVAFEDRQDLLGHRSGRITTHYSAAEVKNLIDAANKVCDSKKQSPVLTILKSTRKIEELAN
ncbi:MAG: tyrosine-type recombinase/integrase [Gammaproteobacteria bacterium]